MLNLLTGALLPLLIIRQFTKRPRGTSRTNTGLSTVSALRTACGVAVGILLTQPTYAQTARDFFQPKPEFNQATYAWRWEQGDDPAERMSRILAYATNHDTLIVSNLLGRVNQSAIRSNQMCVFTKTQVARLGVIGKSVFGLEWDKSYNTPQVIVKMPINGKPAYWTYQDEGENTGTGQVLWSCSSTMTIVTYKGVKRKALRVAKKAAQPRMGTQLVEYYVQGIGLYKTTVIEKDGKESISDRLIEITWNPALEYPR
jgi:hypothetical protein